MRKLMWFAIGFALSAFVGVYLVVPEYAFLCGGAGALLLAVCLLAYTKFPKLRIAGVLLLGLTVGFTWQAAFDAVYLSTPRAADAMTADVTIFVTDYSEETEYGAKVEGYLLLSGKPYRVRAYLPQGIALAPGDSVSGSFLLRATLPGCSRDVSYDRCNGMFLCAFSRSAISVEEALRLPWYGYPAVARKTLASMIQTVLPGDAAAFARALVLGDTDDLSYETDLAFKISGIRHIVAVSGLHVSILFSFLLLLTGKRRRLASILGIPVLFFFAAVAGFSPSITRACIMHGLMSIGALMQKEYDLPTALSFAALVILFCNPWSAGNVAFQLSFGCVAGILLFGQRIQNWLLDKKRLGKYKGFAGKVAHWFAVSVSISLAATVITTPLCAIYFGMVSLISVLTNLLTLWLITFIFYGILICCGVGYLFLPAAKVLGHLVVWPVRFVLWVAKTLAKFPLSAVYMDSVYMVIWLALCYVLLAGFLLAKRKRPLIPACLMCISLCVALFASWGVPLLDECRVTVLDVGQGQCILLQSEGKNFLVDCGGDSDISAANQAASLLRSQGIRRLDGMIVTHYDEDHAAGVMYLLESVPADCLYLPDCRDETGIREQLLTYTGGTVLTVSADILIRYGASQLSLFPSETGLTDNESGLCILFQTENCDILITGDRGFSGEEELLRHTQLPELELLIAGHHGSKYSTGASLLAATTPEEVIISVAADNAYGHPAQEVLDRLDTYGCVVRRTDQDGTIIFRR